MKKWLVALGALVILLAAGVVILLFSLNSIVEKAVNTEGPKITDTAVHLDKADISLFSGQGIFSGFTVGNPEGFGGGHAASVGSILVDIDTSTLLNDTIVVRKVDVDRPELVYELARDTSNFDVLLQNIRRYADGGEKKAAASSGTGGAQKEEAKKKVIIDELVIRNARAALSVPALKFSVAVPLPEIRMKNIGRESSGITYAQTAALVMTEVSRTLAQTAREQTKDISSALLKDGEKAGDKAKNLLKEGLKLFR